MKKVSIAVVLVVTSATIVSLIVLWEKRAQLMDCNIARRRLPSIDRRQQGALGSLEYSEQFLDNNIVNGMTIIEVENIVGKPYRTSEFMGTQRADYLIHSPWTEDLCLSGFCVVYEGGKVKHVDKSWSKLQN